MPHKFNLAQIVFICPVAKAEQQHKQQQRKEKDCSPAPRDGENRD